MRLIDPEGEALTDVTVIGRVSRAFSFGERPTDSDRINIPGITANNPRPVFFYHKDRNLGAFMVVPHPVDSRAQVSKKQREQRTIQLQPCGTLKGRLLDKHGKPMPDVSLGVNPVDLGDEKQRFVIARSDEMGKFTATRIIPGTQFLIHENSSPKGAPIGEVKLDPGEVRDLGEVRIPSEASRRPANDAFQLLPSAANATQPNEEPAATQDASERPSAVMAISRSKPMANHSAAGDERAGSTNAGNEELQDAPQNNK